MERPRIETESSFFNWLRQFFGSNQPIVPANPTRPIPTTTLDYNHPSLLAELAELKKYRVWVEEAAGHYHLNPSLLCGIGSRESRWGLALQPQGPAGTGDFQQRPPQPKVSRTTPLPPDGRGFGRGLLQIDYDWHEFARTGTWHSPRDNIFYACEILHKSLQTLARERVAANLQTRAMLAAYNGGLTNTLNALRKGLDVDANTTGKNYSEDVLDRAAWFQLHGWR
jgi:hypothetical protein